MRVKEIVQTIIIYLQQKGVNTDEQVLRRLELLDKFNAVRSKFLSDMFIKKIQITNTNYQMVFIDRENFDDETEMYSFFALQPTVMGSVTQVRTTDGKCRYREYSTTMEEQSIIKSLVPNETGYVIDYGRLKVDDRFVEAVRVDALFVNPYRSPNFNPNYDQYPIDEALIPQLCEALYEVYFKKIEQVIPDLNNNSTAG